MDREAATPFPEELDTDQVAWRVLPAWSGAFSSADRLPIRRWIDEGRTVVVKHGPHRTVYRVDLPAGRFYLKHDHSPNVSTRGKHLVRASRSRREFERAQEICRRQVPTAQPVAVGELRRLGVVADNFLLTAAIDGACPLDEFLSDELPRWDVARALGIRRQLAIALADLCAQMHQAGVDHDDFHAGNILVRGLDAGAEKLELFLIDVPSVRLGAALDWPASCHSLAVLCSAIGDDASVRDRLRFWREYRRRRNDLPCEHPRQRAREVYAAAIQQRIRVRRSRDKRILRNDKNFYRLNGPYGRAHAVRDVPPEALQPLLADPEQLLRQGAHAPAKLSHSAVVVQAEFDLGSRRVRVAYKRARCKSLAKRLSVALRGNRALRGWQLGHALLSRGIATPKPLFVIVPHARRCWGDGYLATEWLDGALDLHLFAWKLAELPIDERDALAHRAAERIGRLLGRMHAWGVRHRDLKANNLMLVAHGDELRAYVVDLDGVRMGQVPDHHARAADLARLAASCRPYGWLSRTARLRFLRAYLAEFPEPTCWKTLWRAIAAASTRHTSPW